MAEAKCLEHFPQTLFVASKSEPGQTFPSLSDRYFETFHIQLLHSQSCEIGDFSCVLFFFFFFYVLRGKC